MHDQQPIHISMLLDRSGSMGAIADDVVGGFNEFLSRQRRQDGAARVTLVQFDSEDPFELVIDGADLATVSKLRRRDYEPRAATPLYDAIGRLLSRIDAEVARRRADGLVAEDQLVVIVTDGLENASREHDRSDVMRAIEERRRQGWVFAFLGANQDAYAEGAAIGVAPGAAAPWSATPEGARQAFAAAAEATSAYRGRSAHDRRRTADDFFTSPSRPRLGDLPDDFFTSPSRPRLGD